jgi:hypothetical protein
MNNDDIEQELAVVLRGERMRQYRDQDRAKWPGGAYDFEEHQGPWLEARAAMAFLEQRCIAELEARLDAEMRLAGDLEAVLRFVASEVGSGTLAAYIETELKRLSR